MALAGVAAAGTLVPAEVVIVGDRGVEFPVVRGVEVVAPTMCTVKETQQFFIHPGRSLNMAQNQLGYLQASIQSTVLL